METDLDKEFKLAFKKISTLKRIIAPDLMLKFYAYYKQANFGNNFSFNNKLDVRSGFKFNAWMQLNGMSSEQAKQEYINLAKEVLKNNK
ncbi:phosphatidylserine decarboxylase [Polaribacter sp. WD7]|uniref:acyl-CoA-binding protein n=1 Tax=Polaribacter sp. WD7 TaxID=2269061 RepID=UPI000DF1B1B1|nr:acyl-CoA-binding protein [Polaribacter sp. WD7]RCS27559.1 phosphatidylserine decarboxylase [Polaribacter sp. WD7]